MADFRERLLECLGGPWPEPCDLKPILRETIQKDGYRIESVFYEAEPDDKIPAMLLIPEGIDAAHPAPAVAVWRQHNGQWHLGKTEPAGLTGNPMHHTGVAWPGRVTWCCVPMLCASKSGRVPIARAAATNGLSSSGMW